MIFLFKPQNFIYREFPSNVKNHWRVFFVGTWARSAQAVLSDSETAIRLESARGWQYWGKKNACLLSTSISQYLAVHKIRHLYHPYHLYAILLGFKSRGYPQIIQVRPLHTIEAGDGWPIRQKLNGGSSWWEVLRVSCSSWRHGKSIEHRHVFIGEVIWLVVWNIFHFSICWE